MWKQLITELEACGLTQEKIGQAVGLSQGAISQIKNIAGREPAYRAGARLVELHRRRTAARPAFSLTACPGPNPPHSREPGPAPVRTGSPP